MKAGAVIKWGGLVSGLLGTVVGSLGLWQSCRALNLSERTANEARQTTVNQLLADAFDRMGGGQGSVVVNMTADERRRIDGGAGTGASQYQRSPAPGS